MCLPTTLWWKVRFADASRTYVEEWRDGATSDAGGAVYTDDPATHAQTAQQAVPLAGVVVGPRVCGVDMRLTRRVSLAQLSGTVKLRSDAYQGISTPLVNISVSLYTTASATPPLLRLLTVATAADGSFSVPAFPGSYLLYFSDAARVYAAGYYAASGSGSLTTNRNLATIVSVPLGPGATFSVLLCGAASICV